MTLSWGSLAGGPRAGGEWHFLGTERWTAGDSGSRVDGSEHPRDIGAEFILTSNVPLRFPSGRSAPLLKPHAESRVALTWGPPPGAAVPHN